MLLHSHPFSLINADKVAAAAPDLVFPADTVVLDYPASPAMQYPAFADLEIPEYLIVACGTSDTDHHFNVTCEPDCPYVTIFFIRVKGTLYLPVIGVSIGLSY